MIYTLPDPTVSPSNEKRLSVFGSTLISYRPDETRRVADPKLTRRIFARKGRNGGVTKVGDLSERKAIWIGVPGARCFPALDCHGLL